MNVNETLMLFNQLIPEEAKPASWPALGRHTLREKMIPFPVDALPEVLRKMTCEISISRKVPEAMAATVLLAAVGMAIGRNVYFRRKKGFEGRANLYAFIFAARGERKSVTFRPVLAPFFQWMETREKSYQKQLKDYLREQNLAANLELAVAKPGLSPAKRQAYLEELNHLENDPKEKPRNPRFIADDITPEALVKLMRDTGGTAGIFSDDARLIVKMLLGSVYSSSGESREDFLLRPFDGEQPLSRHRVSTGNDVIARPCIGMLLMLQTDFLKKIGHASEFFESGLASRCLFCYPESWVGKTDEAGRLLRADDNTVLSTQTEQAYSQMIFKLLDAAYESREEVFFSLAPRAQEIWQNFYEEVESGSAQGGEYENILDMAIRFPSLVLRIALLLAVVDGAEQIEEAHMLNAIQIMRYYMLNAQLCYSSMTEINIPEHARKILNFFRKGLLAGPRTFSLREIERGTSLLHAEILPALKFLCDHHYCRYLPQQRQKHQIGRSPSPVLEVHPDLME